MNAAIKELEAWRLAACPRVTVSVVAATKPNVIRLTYLDVPRNLRRRGWGTKAMAKLCELADEHELEVELSATDDAGFDVVAWYAGYGFSVVGRNLYGVRAWTAMVRQPQVLA